MTKISIMEAIQDKHENQSRRLIQAFWIVQLVLFLALAQSIWLAWYPQSPIIAGFILVLFSSYIAAKKGRNGLSATFFIFTLASLATYFMWTNSGLRDEAMLIYPILLMFSATVGNRHIFIALFSTTMGVVLLNGYVNEIGWYSNTSEGYGFASALTICTILAATGYAVSLITADHNSLVSQLAEENSRVRASQTQLRKLTNHDPLTLLPNRVLAQDRFEHALANYTRTNSKVALMFLDLDNFKAINDAIGHQGGDEFLVTIAERLQQFIGDSDSLCRHGGDEFLIILESLTDQDSVSLMAENLLRTVEQPVILKEQEMTCTCSIGIAIAPDDGNSFSDILRKADLAMYRAKETGRIGFSFYDEEMDISVRQHMQLINDLRKAVADNQLCLYYQPKIDLRSDEILGAEALLRWHHPLQGLIGPEIFIPLAEKSGLIVSIGEWVIVEACKQCRQWNEMGLAKMTVAVNISSIQFRRGNLDQVVKSALRETGLDPAHLEFELTESLLIDESEQLRNTLRELRQIGIRLTIDDFGTGYSNLHYLKMIEVETLKIDKSFVQRMGESRQDETLVAAIIQIAASLQLKTVAEGIETVDTAHRLKALACDYGQGYYWSRALPADEFAQYVSTSAQQRPRLH